MLWDYYESRRSNSERRDFWVYIGIMCGFGDFFQKSVWFTCDIGVLSVQ